MSVTVTTDRRVATITLAAAERRNALDWPMVNALHDALVAAHADPTVRAIVLRAEGPVFCAGLDPAAVLDAGGKPINDAIACIEGVLAMLAGTPPGPTGHPLPPTVALVAAPALGGGVGLAAACDLVIAGPAATFSLPEARMGLVPATIAPYVQRRTGAKRFRAMAIGMRTWGVADALAIGLVDELAADPDAALAEQLKRLRKASPAALAAIRDLNDAPGQGGARLATWLQRPEVRAALAGWQDGILPDWERE